jgi:hypothetical protein
MGLDIRLPLGLIFLITGLIMMIYGAVTAGSPMYAISGGINLNLIWGAVMLAFGIVMALLGRKKA